MNKSIFYSFQTTIILELKYKQIKFVTKVKKVR